MTGAALAVIIVGFLVWRGEAGRVGLLLAFAAGSVLGFSAVVWDLAMTAVGFATQVVNSLGGAVG